MPRIIKETMKQETKHTPGPWSVTPGQNTIWANDGDTKVAKVWDLPWIESEATGRRHSDDVDGIWSTLDDEGMHVDLVTLTELNALREALTATKVTLEPIEV